MKGNQNFRKRSRGQQTWGNRGRDQQSSENKEVGSISRENFGFLPSAGMLESYEEISPGMVAKLMEMAAREQKHRQALEMKEVTSRRISSIIGFLLLPILLCVFLVALVITVPMLLGSPVLLVLILMGAIFALYLINKKQGKSRYEQRHSHQRYRNHRR
jgi:uncharacterized membrane protein